jgi:hypothetical protein
LPAVPADDFVGAAHPPSLVELPPAVLTGVSGVDEEVDVALASGDFNLVGAVDEVARARLHSEAVERRLAKRRFGALAQIGGDLYVACLERA